MDPEGSNSDSSDSDESLQEEEVCEDGRNEIVLIAGPSRHVSCNT